MEGVNLCAANLKNARIRSAPQTAKSPPPTSSPTKSNFKLYLSLNIALFLQIPTLRATMKEGRKRQIRALVPSFAARFANAKFRALAKKCAASAASVDSTASIGGGGVSKMAAV